MPPSFNPSPAISKETYAAVVGIKLHQLVDLFTPCYMFFYSSLMDVEVLQLVLGLSDIPSVVKGEIKRFSMKM
jgi:hypothetical protein